MGRNTRTGSIPVYGRTKNPWFSRVFFMSGISCTRPEPLEIIPISIQNRFWQQIWQQDWQQKPQNTALESWKIALIKGWEAGNFRISSYFQPLFYPIRNLWIPKWFLPPFDTLSLNVEKKVLKFYQRNFYEPDRDCIRACTYDWLSSVQALVVCIGVLLLFGQSYDTKPYYGDARYL